MNNPGLILFACMLVYIQGCKNNKKIFAIQPASAIQVDSLPGSCPFLAKDNKGNIILSWVRIVNDSSSVFCYALSKDNGQTFEKTILIPSGNNIQPHSENLPKIIVKPSGEFIALWGAANPNPKNKYSGLVLYSQSFDQGQTWSEPKRLVNDSAGYDQRYYDVALLPDGEVAIAWLDNRKTTTKEGSALFFATTQGNKGFQNEKLISQFCCQCCRTDLFVDSKAGIHILYRGIINDSIRDMVHIVSNDGGKNFSKPGRISNDNWVINGCPHTGPSMTENYNGLHFAWFTGGLKKGCFYTQSVNNGNSFTQRIRISTLGSHPQIASLPDGRLAVAWDESMQVDNKYYKKIGIEIRNASGNSEQSVFISADTLTASYPVILPITNEASLVAYNIKSADKSYIMHQRIGFE